VPGLKRLPVLKLIAVGEIALVAKRHLDRLTPAERRRLVELLRQAKLRPRNLSASERQELEEIVAKLAPREFAGVAADKLSPVPLPRRVVYGRQRG